MTTIFGLPAHALLVHAIVVLAPLTALLEILCALWPAARRRFIWLVVVLAIAVTVLTPLTASAGEWLYNREEEHSPILQLHQERGEWMVYFAAAMLIVALLQAAQHWLESTSQKSRTVLAVAVAALSVVVGLSSIVAVVRIGHSGTEAKWGILSDD